MNSMILMDIAIHDRIFLVEPSSIRADTIRIGDASRPTQVVLDFVAREQRDRLRTGACGECCEANVGRVDHMSCPVRPG